MQPSDEIEAAVALAEAETRTPSSSKLRLCRSLPSKATNRKWTAEEDSFVRANLGKISERAIARALKRTRQSVHIRWTRHLHLTAPTKSSEVTTAEQVAIGLHLDGKAVHLMMDRGIMPGRRLPGSGRVIRMVDKHVLLRWLLDFENWIYFKPENVGKIKVSTRRGIPIHFDYDFWEEAKKLIRIKKRRIGDEWITTGQLARELKIPCGARYVGKAIHSGNLPAARWQNWKIKRSSIPKGMTLNFRGEWVPRRRKRKKR